MVFNNGQFPQMVYNNGQELPAFDRRGYPQAAQAPQVAFQSAYATPSVDSDDLDYSGPYVQQQSYNQQFRSSYSQQNGMPARRNGYVRETSSQRSQPGLPDDYWQMNSMTWR